MIGNYVIEVCCGSIEDCIVAQSCNADRIELNHGIELGGLTPSLGTLLKVKELVNIPICCMVRQRTSGFVYTELQYQSMLLDAKLLMENGADGIVFGFLTPEHTIDMKRTKEMAALAHQYGKEAICHKAFDNCLDLDKATQDCIACGIDRILTSGGAEYPDIQKGCDTLRVLNEHYRDKITLLAGGGVRSHNVQALLEGSQCSQVHMTAKAECFDDGMYYATDANSLKGILQAIASFAK